MDILAIMQDILFLESRAVEGNTEIGRAFEVGLLRSKYLQTPYKDHK